MSQTKRPNLVAANVRLYRIQRRTLLTLSFTVGVRGVINKIPVLHFAVQYSHSAINETFVKLLVLYWRFLIPVQLPVPFHNWYEQLLTEFLFRFFVSSIISEKDRCTCPNLQPRCILIRLSQCPHPFTLMPVRRPITPRMEYHLL